MLTVTTEIGRQTAAARAKTIMTNIRNGHALVACFVIHMTFGAKSQ